MASNILGFAALLSAALAVLVAAAALLENLLLV